MTNYCRSGDNFCRVFDLTSRLPASLIEHAVAKKQLTLLDIPSLEARPVRRVLQQIKELLGPEETESSIRKPLRICIPSLGTPSWGDVEPKVESHPMSVVSCLLMLHRLLPGNVLFPLHIEIYAAASQTCLRVCLAALVPERRVLGRPRLDTETWLAIRRLCILVGVHRQDISSLSGSPFKLTIHSANPSLSAIFPSYHGFVHIHNLPAPLALVPPSDKYSSLRGLSSSGENNLAFKCMRKRLVFETLHLDLEGGVSERRTTPASNSIETIIPPKHDHNAAHDHTHTVQNPNITGLATVEVQLEQVEISPAREERPAEVPGESITTTTKKKPKKRVAFTSDRPDLYDF